MEVKTYLAFLPVCFGRFATVGLLTLLLVLVSMLCSARIPQLWLSNGTMQHCRETATRPSALR